MHLEVSPPYSDTAAYDPCMDLERLTLGCAHCCMKARMFYAGGCEVEQLVGKAKFGKRFASGISKL